jgi:hypothetical protein
VSFQFKVHWVTEPGYEDAGMMQMMRAITVSLAETAEGTEQWS